MEAEPAQGVRAHVDGERAVPVAVRPDPAHEVDPDVVRGEGLPVDAPVSQSDRHQPPGRGQPGTFSKQKRVTQSEVCPSMVMCPSMAAIIVQGAEPPLALKPRSHQNPHNAPY